MNRNTMLTTAVVAGISVFGVIGVLAAKDSPTRNATEAISTSTTKAPTVPGIPGNVGASDPYQVDISFDHVANATGYQIWRRPDQLSKYTLIATLKGDDITPVNPQKFSDFPPNLQTYYYKVKAFNQFGISAQPEELVAVPG